jgi:uncharacterized protein (TIGR03546 family)
MFFIGLIKDLIKILQSEISPAQIAGGAALGLVLGFQPLSGPQGIVILLLIFFLNVNIAAAFLAAGIFAPLAVLLDPLAHQLGYLLLVKTEALLPFWTAAYNLPIIPLTHFNNTVVLGSFVLSLLLFIPVLLAAKQGIIFYRTHWKEKVAQSKFMKWFKLTDLWKLWAKFN